MVSLDSLVCRKPPLEAGLELLGYHDTSSSSDEGAASVSEAGSIQAVSLEWGEQGYSK